MPDVEVTDDEQEHHDDHLQGGQGVGDSKISNGDMSSLVTNEEFFIRGSQGTLSKYYY